MTTFFTFIAFAVMIYVLVLQLRDPPVSAGHVAAFLLALIWIVALLFNWLLGTPV